MNELPSAQFRTAYAKLTEPTEVTVNGHVIGTWIPMIPAPQMRVGRTLDSPGRVVGRDIQSRQAQRDALLSKINRSK